MSLIQINHLPQSLATEDISTKRINSKQEAMEAPARGSHVVGSCGSSGKGLLRRGHEQDASYGRQHRSGIAPLGFVLKG